MSETTKLYYSMRETTEMTNLPIATIRYWEKVFDELNPRKDGHGNRYFTEADIQLIKQIKFIRDEKKITRIEAIRNELKQNGKQTDSRVRAIEILERLRTELDEIRKKI